MSDADALLAAVRAAPADDLPRLVYADYLDEHGDPARAEFIRTQIEAANLDEADPARPPLEDRAHELLAANEPAWCGFPADAVTEWEFARGFVDQLRLPVGSAGGLSFTSLALHPVQRLALQIGHADDQRPALDPLSPLLLGITELNVAECLTEDMAWWHELLRPRVLPSTTELAFGARTFWHRLHGILAACSITSQLTSLDFPHADMDETGPDTATLLVALAAARLARMGLTGCNLSSPDLAALLAPPTLASLTRLDVSHNPLGPDAYHAFHHADRNLRLTHLDVSGTPLAGISLEPLLNSPPVRDTLHDLEMSGTGSARRNVEVLADSGFWTRATSLRLHSGTVPAAAFEPLCTAAGPPRLRLLDLADNYLRASGVAMLSAAEWAGELTWLALSRNYLDDDAVNVLATSGRFTRLRTLHLAHNRVFTQQESTAVTDAGAAALARSASLKHLRFLTLSYTAVTDSGAVQLLDAPHWHLAGLGLGGLDLTAGTAAAFAASPRLARLEWLDLSDNPRLGGDALLPLAESPHLSILCELDLGGVAVSDRVAAALRARLGNRLSL